MIARIWHGYTTLFNAEAYEKLLKQEVFTAIAEKQVQGYLGIQLMKRQLDVEVEFTTIMFFEKLESVKQFAGEDYEFAYVPEKAKALLHRFDKTSIHCEVIHELFYDL
ncbi:MAG TPA: antibiotic biosynthesis monooxygenase [Chitinophagaceae bacterium]|nr:antibiotic biosynthesis monooxygenase [Chitinophagaceae bacterium]